MRTVDDGRGLELSQGDIDTLSDIFDTCADEEYFSSERLRVLGRILTWLENGYFAPNNEERAEPAQSPIGEPREVERTPTYADYAGNGTWAGVQRSAEPIFRTSTAATTGTMWRTWQDIAAQFPIEYPAQSARIEGIPTATFTVDSMTAAADALVEQIRNEDNDH